MTGDLESERADQAAVQRQDDARPLSPANSCRMPYHGHQRFRECAKRIPELGQQPGTGWRKILYHFDWTSYPAGSVWLDGNLNPVHSRPEATFVARTDGSEWDHYQYFKDRWGGTAKPVNYEVSKRPYDYGIAIEILSVGHETPFPSAYTERMYATLSPLVSDICARHAIPQRKGRVVGHEDVNPVQRYGWDPRLQLVACLGRVMTAG